MQTIQITLTKKQELCKNTYELTFQLPQDCKHPCLEGQYTWLSIQDENLNDPRGNRRAFSLSSINTKNHTVSIIFRRSPSLYKQKLLDLPIGSRLAMTPPVGSNFVVQNMPEKHLVFIAGGVGIAPFLSLLRSEKKPAALSKKLIFINTSKERAFLTEEIHTLCAEKGILYEELIGSPSDITITKDKVKTALFYVSGADTFIQSAYARLAELDIQRDRMFFEQYYPHLETKMNKYFKDSEQAPTSQLTNPFKMLVDSTSSHLVVTDENGFILYANEAAQRITGFSMSEMRGNTPRLWGGLMSHDFYLKMWDTIKSKKQPFVGEIKNRRKNGEEYYALGRITPIVEDDVVIGFVASEEEITQRVLLEQETQKQKRELLIAKQRDEAMLNSVGEGLIGYDIDGNVLLINEPALEMLGYNREELIGRNFIDTVVAETEQVAIIPDAERLILKALKSKKIVTDTFVYVRKDGSKFIVQVTVAPVVLNGKASGLIQVFRDVTRERRIDTLKTEFISLASHQLRTPLSTINWYLEMVLNGDAGKITEEQKKFVTEAYKGSSRMVQLVNALLNVARIEAGTFIVDPVPGDLVKIARSVLDELKPQIDTKHQSVTLEKDELPLILLDVQLMRIVFQNLLTNAVKYTPKNGSITIRIRKLKKNMSIKQNIFLEEDYFLIQVSDTGFGIPINDQKHIFDKLFRASNAVKTDAEGTGLGLYIVKSIVEQSNGHLWFNSVENKGTEFFVALPISGMRKKEGSRKIE